MACVDCGMSDAAVIDWDHRDPATKRAAVGRMISDGLSWATIEAEIAKCDPRCSSCHMRRTFSFRPDGAPGWRLTLVRAAADAGLHLEDYVLTQLGMLQRGMLRAELADEAGPAATGARRRQVISEHAYELVTAGGGRRSTTMTPTRLRQLLVALFFARRPCVDCGEDDLVVLTADHVLGARERYVAQLQYSGPLPDLVFELTKGVSRCWNCHMRITAVRAGSTRVTTLPELTAEEV